jgi:hypothetical protein
MRISHYYWRWELSALKPLKGSPRWGVSQWCAGSVSLHTPLAEINLQFPRKTP